MNNEITIYWNTRVHTDNWNPIDNNEYVFNPPMPLFNYLTTKLKSNPISDEEKSNHDLYDPPINYLKCPSAQQHLKNTFIIESPIDFSITLDSSSSFSVSSLYPLVYLKSLPDYFFGLNLYSSFFSNSDIELTQLGPHFHTSEWSKCGTHPEGTFNISKWFRPVHPNIILHCNKINVKRGDALYYVKFNTNKKIKFKRFNHSPNLIKIERDNTYYKNVIPNTPLYKLYDLFMSRNYKKRTLKEIKNNLTGY